MSAPTLTEDEARRTIEAIEECMAEGLPLTGVGGEPSARQEAARRLGITPPSLRHRISQAESLYNLRPDPEAAVKRRMAEPFTFDALPHDGEPSAEDLIAALSVRHAKRKAFHDAAKLRQVRINLGGPIAIAGFGDPHVDDKGCAWGDLERDVRICRDTPGMLAVDVGDNSNNWVGRLMRLYADQEVTPKQSLQLIEWLMCALPWLHWEDGNHDCLDEETEVLTRRGWLHHSELRDDDDVLGLNTETDRAEWQRPFSVIRRHHDGVLVEVKGSRVNFSVTPNHRLLMQRRKAATSAGQAFGPHEYVIAENWTRNRARFRVSAQSDRPGVDLSDAIIALCGWVLTDGSIGPDGRVTIYQSKTTTPITDVIAAAGLECTVVTRARQIEAVCGRALVKPPLPQSTVRLSSASARTFLSATALRKGELPKWAADLDRRQFGVLLDAIVAGDGSWYAHTKARCAMVHGERDFLSAVQALCVQHGWAASLSVAREKDFRLNIAEMDGYEVEARIGRTERAYSGQVWCLRTPLGNFAVRREGKVHFTGNSWNTEKGDPVSIMHKMHKRLGSMNVGGTRLQLNLPVGASVLMHVRHDFPGGSQFNPAHAMVRETLFGFRDHIMMCGHRHHTGYIPVWHNDPRRLCHGFRLGTYKDMDHYAAEKGFQDGNWARSMAAVIDPDWAHDPVRFIKAFFSLEEAAEYLTWRRSKWELGHKTS